MINFAYGSNLHPVRLCTRVKSAHLLGTGSILGRRLAFHKKGGDGSGKCDIPESASTSRVLGALYFIDDGDWVELQRIEGVGHGYSEVIVSVSSELGVVEAVAFEAQAQHIDEELCPYDWYKMLVLEGARFHQFPDDYIQLIEEFPSVPDPDPIRSRASWELVESLRRKTE